MAGEAPERIWRMPRYSGTGYTHVTARPEHVGDLPVVEYIRADLTTGENDATRWQREAERLEAEATKLRTALTNIRGWCNAYPIEGFPPVDLAAVRATLGDDVYSKLHAGWARHLLDGMMRYVREGLGSE